MADASLHYFAYRGSLVSTRQRGTATHVIVRGVSHRSAFTLEEQTNAPAKAVPPTPRFSFDVKPPVSRVESMPRPSIFRPVFAEEDGGAPRVTNGIWHDDDDLWSLEGEMPEVTRRGGAYAAELVTRQCRLSPDIGDSDTLSGGGGVVLDGVPLTQSEVESPLPASPTSPLQDRDAWPLQTETERRLLCHLGLFSWGDVDDFAPLPKTDKLFRELKNLDRRGPVREHHKIGVIYVARGWRSKDEILGADCASPQFDEFCTRLGTRVDMQTHQGYTGGLTTPSLDVALYYADHASEVLFHVSTWLAGGGSAAADETGEGLQRYRWQHIGNDDVHIAWCETEQDYSVKWLPTRFGRVSIVIYPLLTGMFRVQMHVKEPLKRWPGPLVDGAVVDSTSLPLLVRLTAVNVSHQVNPRTESLAFVRAT